MITIHAGESSVVRWLNRIAWLGLFFFLPHVVQAGKEMINQTNSPEQGILVSPTISQIPGRELRTGFEPGAIDPSAVRPPDPMLPQEFIPIPDRWRLADAVGVTAKWWDPYNQ